MPCRGPDPTPEELRQDRERDATRSKVYANTKKELDLVTRLLCSILTDAEVKSQELYDSKDPIKKAQAVKICDVVFRGGNKAELEDWWSEHKKLDLKRVALNKLTKEEKEALGIKDA